MFYIWILIVFAFAIGLCFCASWYYQRGMPKGNAITDQMITDCARQGDMTRAVALHRRKYGKGLKQTREEVQALAANKP